MAFPTTSVLDDFNRANAGSLGANWGSDQMNVAVVGHDIVSNAATNGDHSFWSADTFAADQEAWMPIATMAGVTVGLHVRIQNPNTASAGCYECLWKTDGTIEVVRVENAYGTETSLGTGSVTGVASGYKFGAEVTGTGATVTIRLYGDTGSGWTLLGTFTDTDANRITSGGNVGFITGNTGQVIGEFGGGAVVAASGNPWYAYAQMRS